MRLVNKQTIANLTLESQNNQNTINDLEIKLDQSLKRNKDMDETTTNSKIRDLENYQKRISEMEHKVNDLQKKNQENEVYIESLSQNLSNTKFEFANLLNTNNELTNGNNILLKRIELMTQQENLLMNKIDDQSIKIKGYERLVFQK
mgnify:CR=1 FL=1